MVHMLYGNPALIIVRAPTIGDTAFVGLAIITDDHADMTSASAELEGFDVEVGIFRFFA